ncbi:MAG TPA: 50S ribosomal protein L25, partial [Chloroflexia bacterium]|nr:50S ribosomal protein L25 [Chloroflexia bacterium]
MANEHKTYELIVEPRAIIGKKTKQLRRQQLLPAVVYGHNVEAQAVQVPLREMERVYLRAGSNGLVDLKVGQDSPPRKVFIHNIQRDPVTHNLRHIDFLEVNLREEMTATVQLVMIGESPAVDRKEGVLLQALDHVQVRALPADLPPVIEVDISGLEEVDQAIHVSDLTLPPNVAMVTHEEELVAKVTALRAEEVEEVEEAAEGAEAEAGAGEGEDEG